MKANELRIGNWIYTNGEDDKWKVIQVKTISVYGINFNQDTGQFECEFIQPIPLTEEWMLKFGFVHKNERFELKDIVLQSDKDMYEVVLIADDPYCAHFVQQKYKYVHQLQNLVYALTGNELKVKAPVTT